MIEFDPYRRMFPLAPEKATKARVNYRKAKPNAERRCGNCWMFVPKTYSCVAVAGLIDKNDVCKWHEYPRERKK